MEEAVLKFLETGPKNSLQLVQEFGFIKELFKALADLVDKQKIITTHLAFYSTWSKIEK